jgi:surfeit locus 1 family protein
MGRARSAVILLAALLCMGLTARLGWWQLERAATKRALQATWDTRAQQPVLSSSELLSALEPFVITQAPALPSTLEQARAYHQRRVLLRGRWLAQHTVYLDNRPMRGRVGFDVVTPLQLEGRASAILVQRGWVPRNMQDRTSLPKLPLPAADTTVQIEGHLADLPGRVYEFETAASATGAIRQNLDVPSFALGTRLRLLPLSLQQTTAPGLPTRDDQQLLRDWPRPTFNVEKHDGYAFQWFALSALIAGLYAWYQLIKPWRCA